MSYLLIEARSIPSISYKHMYLVKDTDNINGNAGTEYVLQGGVVGI